MAQRVKRLPAMQETWVRSLSQEDPRRRKWQPTPVLLPGKYHGQRSLVGYSPWGRKESDTTERLHFTFPSTMYARCSTSLATFVVVSPFSLFAVLMYMLWLLIVVLICTSLINYFELFWCDFWQLMYLTLSHLLNICLFLKLFCFLLLIGDFSLNLFYWSIVDLQC